MNIKDYMVAMNSLAIGGINIKALVDTRAFIDFYKKI